MALITCPACGALVSAETGRCSACGVPLGEDNRCGRCLAIAAVFERTGRHVCSACGETRPRYSTTVVSSEAALLQAFEPVPSRLGVASGLGAGVVAAALMGSAGWLPAWAAVLVGGAFAVAAARVFWNDRVRQQRAHRRRRYEMEQRIIGLAFLQDGMLSAQLVSETLRLALNEARELLGELVATGRARAETNPETGDTSYYFGEAKRTRGLRVRPSLSS